VVSTSAELVLSACVNDVCWCDEYGYMWSSLFNEGVNSSVCHPEGIKACVNREEACPLLSGYSIDKVTTGTKIDKKLASKVAGYEWVFNDVTKIRNESAMAKKHCKARDLTVSFWESDSAEIQVTHVQGRLKQNLGFGKIFYKPHRQYLIV